MPRLVIISDTHNKHKQLALPPGDVLIHCGDFSNHGYHKEVRSFFKWYAAQPHPHKILIAGNHDFSFDNEPDFFAETINTYQERINYLKSSAVEIEGLKFWGSPYQPEFGKMAFNLPRGGEELYAEWSHIPVGTDVLITHGPPKRILDRAGCRAGYSDEAGCELLLNRVLQVKPKLHLFGHIHEGYGMIEKEGVAFINASIHNFEHRPNNAPVVLDIESGAL